MKLVTRGSARSAAARRPLETRAGLARGRDAPPGAAPLSAPLPWEPAGPERSRAARESREGKGCSALLCSVWDSGFFFFFFSSCSFPTSILSPPLEVLPYLNGISGDRSPLCKEQT